MWHSAKAIMTRHVGVPIPTGIPAWGVDEDELPQARLSPHNAAPANPPTAVEGVSMKAKKSGKRADTPSAGSRPRHPDWESQWQ